MLWAIGLRKGWWIYSYTNLVTGAAQSRLSYHLCIASRCITLSAEALWTGHCWHVSTSTRVSLATTLQMKPVVLNRMHGYPAWCERSWREVYFGIGSSPPASATLEVIVHQHSGQILLSLSLLSFLSSTLSPPLPPSDLSTGHYTACLL